VQNAKQDGSRFAGKDNSKGKSKPFKKQEHSYVKHAKPDKPAINAAAAGNAKDAKSGGGAGRGHGGKNPHKKPKLAEMPIEDLMKEVLRRTTDCRQQHQECLTPWYAAPASLA
jgi:hypothetical protein